MQTPSVLGSPRILRIRLRRRDLVGPVWLAAEFGREPALGSERIFERLF